MIDKKRLCSYLIMAILTVALILTTLFVPITEVISRTMDSSAEIIPEASGVFSLLGFTGSTLDLFGASYEADGPVWLSILGVTLNWLVLIFAIVLLGFLIFELCSLKKNGFLIKQNLFTKKFALVTGYFAASVAVFEIVAFNVTTALAAGYFVYSMGVQVFVSAIIAVGILICAYLSGKRNGSEQKQNKVRDCISFALAFVCSILFMVFIFAPQTLDGLSFWQMSKFANEIVWPIAGEYFVGISQWAVFALYLVLAFVCVYSVIGFIRSLQGKSINWLSAALKRWSMAWLIVCIVYLFLIVASTLVFYGCVWVDGIFVLSWTIFIMIILPIIPYFISTNIALNKKQKNK